MHDDERRRPPLAGPLGRGAERLYRVELDRRNRRFDRGRGVTRLDRPVVSVGNLSVGGTGKTPMVAWVVERLLEAGRRPCIAMRGYKRRNAEHSDEETLYRERFPGVPVVAQPDRIGGLRALFAEPAGARVDCVVLDDGYQHRRLARDLDLVLVDASRALLGERCLPAGWLREPVESLARADAIVLTHAERAEPGAVGSLVAALEARFPRALVGVTRHVWESLRVADDGSETAQSVAWLRGRRVVAACAIGHPSAFVAMVREACGTELAGTIIFRDHARFTDARVEALADLARERSAEAIVVTEKDWSKLSLASASRWPCTLVRPVLSIGFDRGADELRARLLERTGG